MKNKLIFLVMAIMLFSASIGFTLTAGDIAIIGVNTDATKSIAFVTLDDFPSNTTISFTDNGWDAINQTWRTSEGIITWNNPATTSKGTVVTITFDAAYTADVGNVTTNTNFNLSASGDQVLAYEGTTAPSSNTETTWLYGFSTENFVYANNSNTSDIPTALINASAAMTTSTTETDNAYFANGSAAQTSITLSGTKADLLVLFNDSSKYYQDNTGPLTFPNYNITVSNGVMATEPTNQPTNIGFNTVTATSFNVTYNAAVDNPDGYIAIRKASSAPTTDPSDGTGYSIGSAVGDGVVAYSGSSTSFSENSLSSNTTYFYKIYSYNGAGSITNYLISNPLSGSQATLIGIDPPPAPVATTASGITNNSFIANWNPATGAVSYRLDVSNNSGFSSFVTGYNNLAVSGTSQSVTGLNAATTYYYRIRAANSGGTSSNSNTITVATTATDPFNGYYNPVSGLSGAALKDGLHILVRDTQTVQFSYTSTTDQLRYVDEDSTNTNNVIELYTGWSVPKTDYGTAVTDWNKEHTWSKSHGDFGETAPAGTDLHNLRPCDATVNSQKSNRDFDEGATPYTDDSPPNGYSGVTGCYYSVDIWEPRDEDKGDVARIIFFMDTRYEGTDTAFDLEIVDYVDTAPLYEPLYGKLSTLLAWHYADPPDSWERRRNNRIQERQGNRNPFIDHPEYVTSIWGGAEPPSITTTAITAITLTTATGGGNVTSAGTASVTARGVCWNTAGSPTLADNYTTNGTGTGTFVSSLTSLTPGQTYYVRAYATNSVGTSYGNEVSFTTLKAEPALHVTNFTAGTPTATTIPLSWTDAVADGYLVKASSVSFAAIVAPTDGETEPDAAFVKNIAQGAQVCTFTSLSNNTTYYFKIYPYTNSGTDINYKTDGSVPQASALTSTVVELIVVPASLSFTTAYGTYSAAQSCSITSSGLTLPIDITSAGPYEFCLTESGTYSTTLQLAANFNGIAWVKFHPAVIGSFTNPISFTSGAYNASISTIGNSYDPNASAAVDLFISEYIEGSSYNKALEIFNGTGQTVNLQNYRISNYYNGGLTPNTLVLDNIDLLNGDCYTIVNNQAVMELQTLGDLLTGSFAINFNGDDAVVLEKTPNGIDWYYVDIFGKVGDDPGAAWTADGGYTTVNSTLVRHSNVIGGITINPTGTGPTAFTTLNTEWDIYPSDTFSNFGTHTFIPFSTPATPSNLVITAMGSDIQINWDDDPAVMNWTVWSSDEPFSGYTLRATVTSNSCTLAGESATYTRRFYYIIANN